jgi:hypothetical protein
LLYFCSSFRSYNRFLCKFCVSIHKGIIYFQLEFPLGVSTLLKIQFIE